MVVYYHRIAEDDANAWTVSFELFRRQVRWMKRRFDMISLDEAQRRIRAGKNHRPSVSITFDDGYAVNCQRALPWLIEQRMPCTYFVTAHNVLHEEPFLHDLADGNRFEANSIEQLRDLDAAGVSIGAHSRTHANLAAIADLNTLYDEVVVARDDLERAIGVEIRHFAFPFGLHANLHVEAFRLAREAGYAGVCSAYGGYNFPGDDAFHLQRIGGEGPTVRLKNWLTLDPLKQRRVRRFEYAAVLEDACVGVAAS